MSEVPSQITNQRPQEAELVFSKVSCDSTFPGDTDVLASAIEGGFEKDNSPAVDAVDEKEAIGTGDAAIDL